MMKYTFELGSCALELVVYLIDIYNHGLFVSLLSSGEDVTRFNANVYLLMACVLVPLECALR